MHVAKITADQVIRIKPGGASQSPVILCWRNRGALDRSLGIIAPREVYVIAAEPAPLPFHPFRYAVVYPEYAVILRPRGFVRDPGSVIVRHPHAREVADFVRGCRRPFRGAADVVLEFNPRGWEVSLGFRDDLPGGNVRNEAAGEPGIKVGAGIGGGR